MSQKKIYRVYRHICPDGMIYVGVTSQKLKRRWIPSGYKGKSLYQYIKKYGWQSIQHEVIYTCDDRTEALAIEDEMICYWVEKGVCINKQRSGLIKVSDVKVYNKAWYAEHREEKKAHSKAYRNEHREECRAYDKERRSTPERKVYNRVNNYNQKHPDNITITALEARDNYTTYSMVPSFIKHDDIPNAILYNPSVSTDQLPLF